MTTQNPELDQDDELTGVREAYAATPAPRPAAVEAAVAAAITAATTAPRGVVARDAIALPRRNTGGRSWVRWTPVVLLAAACVLMLVRWRYDAGRDTLLPRVMARSAVRAPASSNTPVAAIPPAVRPPTASPAAGTPQPALRPTHIGAGATRASRTSTPTLLDTPSAPMMARDTIAHDSVPVPQSVASAPPITPSERDHSERDRAVQGLDDESATLVLHILDSATAHGLPLAPLATRVQEGVRRGVPGPRIVVVLRNYADALAGARDGLGTGVGGAELQSGAEAILAGAPTAALRQIRTARREGSLVEPLMALADLAAHGVSPLRASAALAALVGHSGSDASVRTLRAEVIGDIVRGVSPDAALAGRLRSVGDEPRGGRLPLGGTRDSTPLSGGVP